MTKTTPPDLVPYRPQPDEMDPFLSRGKMRLNTEQRRILAALQAGCTLKIHRTLDGAKVYRLRCSGDGEAGGEELPAAPIDALERHGYLQSNMKFPAATLLLTERGVRARP